MRIWLMVTLLAGLMSTGITIVDAADEQRQAYDRMVEESVKEADEFVEQKAAEKQAQKQRQAEQKAEEAARLEKSKQEKKASHGTHIRSRPSDPEPPVEAVPLPSGADSPGNSGSAPAVVPASPAAN
jgi:rhamnose utilization protein RhaD (predicted bifunctional aldolase and dehydrogenase)